MIKKIHSIITKYQISQNLFICYFVSFVLIAYFSFFAIFGRKGLINLHQLQMQIEKSDLALQEFSSKLEGQQLLVNGLKLESLDYDLLDEQSRKILGYAGKKEVVIYPEAN